jgi:D-alanine transaminase
MLAGITRAAVLELAAEAGLTVVERPFRPDEAAGASEAFLTSSIRGILPVTRLDGRPLGDGQPGPIYQRLSELYAARYLERRSSASPSRNSSSSSPT